MGNLGDLGGGMGGTWEGVDGEGRVKDVSLLCPGGGRAWEGGNSAHSFGEPGG